MKSKQNWRKTKLGRHFRIKHGYAFKGEFFANTGPYILLTPGNFKEDGGIALKGEKEKYYIGDFPKEFLLKKGDLLVVMTDLTQNAPILGSPAFIKEDNKFLHNQRLGKIVDLRESELQPSFLYYLFNYSRVRSQIKASATGTTVRHTAPDRIYAVEVELPPLPIQRKIAEILSAYDDLIENNRRRIAILEEMAQTLYQEWFVKFRFPGHEQVPLVESELGMIPQGWRVVKLGDLIELAYGKALKANQRNPGNVPVYGSSGIVGYHEEKLIDGPGIIVGRKGNVGTVFWSDSDFYPIDTVFYVRTQISLYYVYYNLQNQQFINSDAAVPGLNRHQAYALNFLLPSEDILKHFEEFIKPFFAEKFNLQRKIASLRRARDMLLPKLISGEIDVSSWVAWDAGAAGNEALAAMAAPVAQRVLRESSPIEPIDASKLERRSLWE